MLRRLYATVSIYDETDPAHSTTGAPQYIVFQANLFDLVVLCVADMVCSPDQI